MNNKEVEFDGYCIILIVATNV